MQPREWFGVGIRLFGVWRLLSCVDELRLLADSHLFAPSRTPVGVYLLHAAVDGVIGLYLLGGAHFLSVCAFPRRDGDTSEAKTNADQRHDESN